MSTGGLLQLKSAAARSSGPDAPDLVVVAGGNVQAYDIDGTTFNTVGNSSSVMGGTITQTNLLAISALDDTSIAVCNRDTSANWDLVKFEFDGTDWNQVGNRLEVPGVGATNKFVAAMGPDACVTLDDGNNMRWYEFDGTDWAQVGNTFTGVNGEAACALSQTRVAVARTNTLTVYDWDGTDFSSVASVFTAATLRAVTALDEDTIMTIRAGGSNLLLAYELSGGTLSNVANTSVPSGAFHGLAAIAPSDFVYANFAAGTLQIYDWDGASWTTLGSAFSKAVSEGQPICSCSYRLNSAP
jgi:hypothetical protein